MQLRNTVISTAIAIALFAGLGGSAAAPAVAPKLRSEVARIDASVTSVVRAPAGASTPIGARIVHQWNDASKTRVVLRVGVYKRATKAGFGWVKILQKHRIYSLQTIVFVTRAPGGGVKQANGNYRYTAYANKKVCTKRSCYYTDSVPVIAIVSRSTPPSKHGVPLGGGRVGVITTYCANANRADACPSWVDSAFAGFSTSSSSTDTGEVTESTVELSYKPASKSRSNR